MVHHCPRATRSNHQAALSESFGNHLLTQSALDEPVVDLVERPNLGFVTWDQVDPVGQ